MIFIDYMHKQKNYLKYEKYFSNKNSPFQKKKQKKQHPVVTPVEM